MAQCINEIVVVLSDEEAYALAELCKRIGFSDCRSNAVSDSEAYLMLYATSQVRRALEQKGVVVR